MNGWVCLREAGTQRLLRRPTVIRHGDLLIARVQVTAYNQPLRRAWLLFSGPWSSNGYQAYSVEGADAVI